MLVDVICVGDVWIWVGFWRRLGGSGFGSKMEESKVSQNGENIISHIQVFKNSPEVRSYG